MPLSSDTERLTPVMAALWASSAARSSERYSSMGEVSKSKPTRRLRPGSLLSFSVTKHRYSSFFLPSARKAEEARRPAPLGESAYCRGSTISPVSGSTQRASLGRLLGIKAHAAAVRFTCSDRRLMRICSSLVSGRSMVNCACEYAMPLALVAFFRRKAGH